MTWRAAGMALFAGIVILTLDPAILRRASSAELARRADPLPEFAAFIAEVRSRTGRGDTIALVLPFRKNADYSPLHLRTSYHLAGREVLPLITHDAAWVQTNLERAGYVAAWGVRFRGPGRVIYEGNGGVLVRQR